MPEDIISSVRCDLLNQVDEKTRNNYQRVFKEKVTFYGVDNYTVDKIAARHYPAAKSLGKEEIFRFCEELFQSDYCEEAFIACNWAYRLRRRYTPDDFATFEKWLRKYVNNWAKCDMLCNHTIGSFMEMYPQFIKNLKQWAKAKNRWLRRAAAVTLIVPAKRGKFLDDIFDIAGILLTDPDDLVQKGYGWMLKDASIQHQTEIFDYVMKNKKVMPRTALRYAIERMPAVLKRKAMAK